MPKISQVDFSIGQQLKAESFTGEIGNWPNVPPVVAAPAGGARQVGVQTSVQGGDEQNSITVGSFAIPKPLRISATPVLKAKQFWEGTVISCHEKEFVARIADRTNPSNPEEVVTFQSDEISEDDARLVAPGASFYWTIGTERSPAGQVRNVALVNFRRAPRWNRVSFRKASQRAAEVLSLFSQG